MAILKEIHQLVSVYSKWNTFMRILKTTSIKITQLFYDSTYICMRMHRKIPEMGYTNLMTGVSFRRQGHWSCGAARKSDG